MAWSHQSSLATAQDRARGDLAGKIVLGLSAAKLDLPQIVYLNPDGEITYEWPNGLTVTIGGEVKEEE